MNKIKILVVDDSPTIRGYVKDLLEKKNYEVVLAENGLEAIQKVYSDLPELIISDVQMPKMTGYQLSRYLKSDESTKDIPLIMLTSEEEQRDRFWGLKSGANLYLTKGFDVEVLLESIEKLLADPNRKGCIIKADSKQDAREDVIIAKVNNLLDFKLLESTIVNEITELVNSIRDFDETIKAGLELLGNIFDFSLAGILIKGEENNLDILIKGQVDIDLIDAFKERVLKELEDKEKQDALTKTKLKIYNKEAIILNPNDEGAANSNHKKLSTFLIKPLMVRNEVLGLLALGSLHKDVYVKENIYFFDIVVRYLAIILDNALLHKETQALAITDGLTKVYNHRYFQTQLKFEIIRAKRYKRPMSLLMIDVDYFKHYNDTHGHQAGDGVLQEVAKIIKFNLRDSDIVARYGGEEFVVILPEANPEGVVKVGERIREEIEKTRFYKEETQPGGRLTISLGGASCPEDGEDNETLVRAADERLYRAKNTGRNKLIIK